MRTNEILEQRKDYRYKYTFAVHNAATNLNCLEILYRHSINFYIRFDLEAPINTKIAVQSSI